MSDRELDLSQLNGRSHGDASQTGDAPAAGVRSLGNESVCVTTIENARDLSALPTGIGDCFQMWRVLEFASDIRIGKPSDRVLSVQ